MLRFACLTLLLALLISSCSGTEENDLWLFLSSYEDVGITPQDLAFFLATHGYDAEPSGSYVTVKLQDGNTVYLTPNGASPRLADLWMTPPAEPSGPVAVLPAGAVKMNVTYAKSSDPDFLKTLSRYLIFPVTPLGMCYDGSQELDKAYTNFGYNVTYMYDPQGFEHQGHLWVVVEDKSKSNVWLAVDSYYGVVTSDNYYYTAPYSFDDFKYLDSVNPKWNIA
jgi:hypothetical protein